MTPAVLYGEGNEAGGSTALAVPTKIVDYTLHHFGDNALYNIAIDGSTSTARVVDAQRDPVSGRLVHVDFAPVNMTERIEITVPLHVTGEAPGVEEGGVLQQVAYEIQVESLPGDIPQEITLDVSGLGMNENLTLGDLTLPEGVTLALGTRRGRRNGYGADGDLRGGDGGRRHRRGADGRGRGRRRRGGCRR